MKLRKWAYFGLVVVISLFIGSCSTDINDHIDNFDAEMDKRAAANQEQVDKLRYAGIISDDEANKLNEGISKQANKIKSAVSNKAAGSLSDVTYKVMGELSQDPINIKANNKDDPDAVDGTREDALNFISDDQDALDDLMETLNFKVYVLRRDPTQSGLGENSIATLDQINYEIKRFKEKGSTGTNLQQYFVNSEKTLWDLTDKEKKLIKQTVDGGVFDSTESTVNVIGEDFIGIKKKYDKDGNYIGLASKIQIVMREFNTDAVAKLTGGEGVDKDMYVIDKAHSICYLMEYPVYYVKGFDNSYLANYEKSDLKVNILTGKIYTSDGKECVTSAGNILSVCGNTGKEGGKVGSQAEGKASFIIDGIKGEPPEVGYKPPEAKDNPNWEPKNKEEFGRVVLRDYLELSYMPDVVEGEIFAAVGRRLRLTKFKGSGDEEIGVFIDKEGNIMMDSLPIKSTHLMDIGASDKDKRVKIDIESSANNVSGSNGSNGAGSNGSGAGGSNGSNGSNGAGSNGSNGSQGNTGVNINPTVTTSPLGLSVNINGNVASLNDVDSNTNNGVASLNDVDVTSTMNNGQSQARLSDIEYAGTVVCGARFPGGSNGYVAKEDDMSLGVLSNSELSSGNGGTPTPQPSTSPTNGNQGQSKHVMYGMAVDIDPFVSNLYSGWISVTGETDTGSLDWWNKWLAESTYKYKIDRDRLNDFLTGNYTYEMRENGLIILDIPTIMGIQKIYNHQEKVAGASWLKTMFVILGMIMIIYASLIMLAWAYDTNIVAGVRLLGILSFNRWVAIIDEEELPYVDEKDRKYMNLKRVSISSAILICIGILIVMLDGVGIIDSLVNTAGLLAQAISDVLEGVKN